MDKSVWLRYDKADRGTWLVSRSQTAITVKATWQRETSMWQRCCISAEFNEKLRGMCNYNPALVVGSKKLRASSYKDHAATDMHKQALLLFKKQSSTDVTEYALIANAHSNLLFMSEHDWYLSHQDQLCPDIMSEQL